MPFQPVCWPMLTLLPLPLIVQCCGTPQDADKDVLSLTKFMRLGPLKSDSYCDSDDKIQPVRLLVKQRSGSQSVDKLAEAPQSFAHDSKHCNHPNLLLSRPNNQSESNRNNDHKPQCKSPKTNKWLTLLTWSGLEYVKNASVSQKQGTCPTLPQGGVGDMHSTPLYAILTLLLPLQPNSQQTEYEIRATLWDAVKRARRCETQ